MADTFSHPRVFKNSQNTQLSYELPHRVHTSQAYPIKSPNGSTIILYGHENGVRVIWRGGRKFKPKQATPTAPEKTNGSSNAVISLDSDDEGPPEKNFEDTPEFEDEEEEQDLSKPFPDVIQTLDLHFGTDVLHLAILPGSILKADGQSWKGLESLKQSIVFAAACGDNSIRLVTLPLTPPSPESKARPELRSKFMSAHAGNGTWGESIMILNGHQKPADGVSITTDVGGSGKELARADSKAPAEPSIIVSSHSKEVTGLVLMFRIPLSTNLSHIEPFQTIYLPSPATKISFNPSLSLPRASHLLVAESTGVCRIYDYKLLSKRSEDPESLAAEHGTWLLSLYAGFQNSKTETQELGSRAGFGRKQILDAQWVSAGRAVIVLLNDGEWAVWDIEGVGPKASQGLLGGQGIKGGSKTAYSLTGYIEGARSRTSGVTQTAVPKFAPMTPGTRKLALPFGANISSGPSRGGISVQEIPSLSPTNQPEDSIVFWLGETFTLIPSLQKYWIANSSKSAGTGSVFNGTSGSRMIKLEGIDLHGERCSGITQVSKTHPVTGFLSDIIILGEHRFTLLFAGKQSREPLFKASGRLALQEKKHSNGAGELDVMGIEQALTRMEERNPKRKLF